MVKLFLIEQRRRHVGGEYVCWRAFTDDGLEVGVIEVNKGQWKRGDFICTYLQRAAGDLRQSNFNNNEVSSVFEGKKRLEKFFEKHPEAIEKIRKVTEEKRSNISMKFLPASEEAAKDFFPTPSGLAGKMIGKVRKLSEVKTILEPSAGLGDLAKATRTAYKKKMWRSSYGRDVDIDVIEIDSNLRKILKDEYRVVHDDFLSYSSRKKYDLIMMNPPFSHGAEHLLKAMDMQRKTGGQIVCLLNAETIRNPYTVIRKQLCRELALLGKDNCTIEFVSDAFKKAKRQTSVEVAVVYCNFPEPEMSSSIYEKMEKAERAKREECFSSEMISADRIDGLIQMYQLECSAGLELIREYRAMVPHMLTSLKESSYNSPILQLKVHGHDCDENEYLKAVRTKYWSAFFDNEEFTRQLTSTVRDQFRSSVDEMSEYEFSRFNIQQVLQKMASEMVAGIEETIIKLFDELSAEHAYFPECKENIWGYSGWKTNKSHKVNYKCIVPCYGIYTNRSWDTNKIDRYAAYSFLADIEKTLNYLDGRGEVDVNLERQIECAVASGQTKNIKCKYFEVTFYKKGTCHIKFTNHYVVDVLNIYAARNRGWLPPRYGNVKYDDMTQEEKSVIDEFQGREAYDEVVADSKAYLCNPASSLCLLDSGKK